MNKLVVWGVVLAAWTVLAVVFAASTSLTYILSYRPPLWGRTLTLAFTEWYAWAVLTPLVAWLATRLRMRANAWVQRAILLAVAGWPIAFLKVTTTRVARIALGYRIADVYVLLSNYVTHYLIFWAIVAIVHVVLYYRAERERELRASEAEARLARAQLQVLRMQLHPHFLFNTLNAISELIHESPAAAERMIAGLSHLLRETLEAGSVDLVPVRRELELLDRYLGIQRQRFGERLQTEIDAAATVGDGLVPIFILQPLVENAIKHGIGAHRGGGRVSIRAERHSNGLVLTVTDDGAGITAHERGDGVGLTNTRARLEAVYGDAHRFEVGDEPGGGTCVRITVPWRQS